MTTQSNQLNPISLKATRLNNNELSLSFSILFFLSFNHILLFVKSVNGLLFGDNYLEIDTYLLYFILLMFIINAILKIFNKIKLDVLFLLIIYLFLYLLSIFINPKNLNFMFTNFTDFLNNPLYYFLFSSWLMYAIVRNLNSYRYLFQYFPIFSIFNVLFSLITFLTGEFSNVSIEYMTFSYNILPFVIFLNIYSIYKGNIAYLLFGIFGSIIIFLTGARGPLIILIISQLFFSFAFFKLNFKTAITILIFIVFCGILVVFWENLLIAFSDLLTKLNFESRNIQYILNNEFLSDSGRYLLLQESIAAINVFGYGLYGDRLILGGSYVHNIFVELILHFGLIFGPIIISFLMIHILRLSKTKNTNTKILFIIFFSTGFVKLLITGSYLSIEPSFYILLALASNDKLKQLK